MRRRLLLLAFFAQALLAFEVDAAPHRLVSLAVPFHSQFTEAAPAWWLSQPTTPYCVAAAAGMVLRHAGTDLPPRPLSTLFAIGRSANVSADPGIDPAGLSYLLSRFGGRAVLHQHDDRYAALDDVIATLRGGAPAIAFTQAGHHSVVVFGYDVGESGGPSHLHVHDPLGLADARVAVRDWLWDSQWMGARFAAPGAAWQGTFLFAHYEPPRAAYSAAEEVHVRLDRDAAVVLVELANTGRVVWPADGDTPVRLGSHWRDHQGRLVRWDGERVALPHDVAPGGRLTMSLPLANAPPPGVYVLELDLVREGLIWFSQAGVPTRTVRVRVTSGYGATYQTASLPAMLPGTAADLDVTATNTGTIAWPASAVRLSYHVVRYDGAVLLWDGPRAPLLTDVTPGGAVRTRLPIQAPRVPGTYVVRVDLVHENVTWASHQGVAPGEVRLAVISDRRARVEHGLARISRSAPGGVSVTVTNLGAATIASTGSAPVMLASHWLSADGRVLLWDGPRAALPRALQPGDRASLTLPLAPPPAGASILVVDLVQEGMAWFETGDRRAVVVDP